MSIEKEALKAGAEAMKIPGQIRKEEAAFLYRLARRKGNLVEIGGLHGRSTSVLIRAARIFGANVTTIDPFVPTPNTQPQPSQKFWEENLKKSGLRVPRLLKMMSHDASLVYEGEVHFLFIDGNHSFENVREDIQDWVPRIPMGGIIAFHDMFQPAIPGVARAVVDWWIQERESNPLKWELIGMEVYVIAFRRAQ